MNIIVYEDEGYKNFLPLTWTRPVFNLRCGINTLAEKIARQYPKNKINYSCRYYLPGEKVMKFDKGLFINGRILAHSRLAKEIPLKGPDQIFISGDEIVAIRAVSKTFHEVSKKARIKKVRVKVLKYPWELVNELGEQLREDKNYLKKRKRAKVHKSVVIYNPSNVFIDEGAEVEANTVLDARHGPIYIGVEAIVRPQSYLKGPVAIGPVCRVAGEIGESIFHGYSNKQHYGFIGHSYIGEWVNLGAGTTNSDLKNNYSTIRVKVAGKKVDTASRFVGCFIGDHAKTSIGTMINSGTVIGVGANVFGASPVSKYVPSFAWGNKKKYDLAKFLETAKAVMSRRKVKFSTTHETLFNKLYKIAK